MYAIKVVCKEVLDFYDFPIVSEDEVVWLTEDEYGELDHYKDYGSVPEEVMVFNSTEEADSFMKSNDLLWYTKPKSYEIVQVEPVYEKKIVGWDIKKDS